MDNDIQQPADDRSEASTFTTSSETLSPAGMKGLGTSSDEATRNATNEAMVSFIPHSPTGIGAGVFQDATHLDEKRQFEYSSNFALKDYLALATRPRIGCTRPTCTKRYEHGIIQNEPEDIWNFKPAETLNLSSSLILPEFWETSVHPDGLRYFKLSSPRLKFTYVTEANICEGNTCSAVHQLITELERKGSMVVLQSQTEIEVYLEVADLEADDSDTLEARWKYYMVDHALRRIFWLDEFDATDMSLETGGISAESKDVFMHKLASEYWMHIENFPDRTIPASVLETLSGILLQWSIDQMTSLDSTAPYSPDVLERLVKMVDRLKVLLGNSNANTYAVFCIARLMVIIESQRVVHLHGCKGARVTRYQHIRGPPGDRIRRSIPFRFLSVITFGESEAMLRKIDKVWFDEIIQSLSWSEYGRVMKDYCRSCSTYSGFILLLNIILFNQYPIIDGLRELSLPISLLYQVSTFLSIGSAACSLALLRKTKTNSHYSATQAAQYMQNIAGTRRRREVTATIFSIPYALLFWSGIAFVTNLALLFVDSRGSFTNTRLLVQGAISPALCGLIILLFSVIFINDWPSQYANGIDN